jgi:hypothetical protein
MKGMQWFVRGCAIYNVSGASTLVIPGALPLVGVSPPAPFWLWLPALIGCFAAIVLWISSSDLSRYAAFPYWNALIRLTFVILTFALDFAAGVGRFATLLALGDLVLALVVLIGLPRVLKRSALAVLLAR